MICTYIIIMKREALCERFISSKYNRQVRCITYIEFLQIRERTQEKTLEVVFYQSGIPVANKYVEKCSTSLVIKGMGNNYTENT